MIRILIPWFCLLLLSSCSKPLSESTVEVVVNEHGAGSDTKDVTQAANLCPRSTPTAKALGTIQPDTEREPGLLIRGYVCLPDGSSLAGVKIIRSYAVYPGEILATTNSDGYYESNFHPIPGDEMVHVWAELPGFTFEPADPDFSWESGSYTWRHYYGYEEVTLDFIAKPAP